MPTSEEKIAEAWRLLEAARRTYHRCPTAENLDLCDKFEMALNYLLENYQRVPA